MKKAPWLHVSVKWEGANAAWITAEHSESTASATWAGPGCTRSGRFGSSTSSS